MEKGQQGYAYIPKKYLVPIKTAADAYLWTAKKIYQDPLVIYRQKIKPSKIRIFYFGLKNLLTI